MPKYTRGRVSDASSSWKNEMDDQLAERRREVSGTIAMLREHCGSPENLEYFIRLAERYFGLAERKTEQEALILGTAFPGTLLRANGILPHWIVGGGLSVGDTIDSRVPRDADAISRSMFGYVEHYLDKADHRTPIIVPITGDNQRKIAYLLKEEGRNVIPVDIAPEIRPMRRYASLETQLDTIMSDLTFYWNLPGERKRLDLAVRMTEKAETLAAALIVGDTGHISGLLKMFLLNTYFYAEDLEEWSGHVTRLLEELKTGQTFCRNAEKRPGVLIAGSPILFPNYKVPVLLNNCGLSVLGTCDCISCKVLSDGIDPAGKSRNTLLTELVRQTYDNDCTGAFVSNQVLYDQASRLLELLDVRGVVFHIIKGQIEYDFELDRMEQLFAQYQIPVFRLETDYHDNDMEQLRIRLEAFSELLAQDMN